MIKKTETILEKEATSSKKMLEQFVIKLMNSNITFHVLHLKTRDEHLHTILNELYDEFPDRIDELVEYYQGASEALLDLVITTPDTLDTKDETIEYLRQLCKDAQELCDIMEYNEVTCVLTKLKQFISKSKYKLIFL